MKIQLDAATQAMLDGHSTIRCVCQARYKGARNSDSVIDWAARKIVNRFNAALAAHLERPTTSIDFQLNCILLSSNRAFICYDVFLEGCDTALRAEIDSSSSRPIHYVEKRGDVCYVRRHPASDVYVATRYADMRTDDHGPRPYFMDEDDPPVYQNEGE
ncbi:hypothetical protein MBLNU457_g2820t1 [Dothideomycetes sp. NU457]